MAHGDRDPVEALAGKLANQNLDDWHLSDGDQWFRDGERERPESGAYAPCKNDSPHRRSCGETWRSRETCIKRDSE